MKNVTFLNSFLWRRRLGWGRLRLFLVWLQKFDFPGGLPSLRPCLMFQMFQFSLIERLTSVTMSLLSALWVHHIESSLYLKPWSNFTIYLVSRSWNTFLISWGTPFRIQVTKMQLFSFWSNELCRCYNFDNRRSDITLFFFDWNATLVVVFQLAGLYSFVLKYFRLWQFEDGGWVPNTTGVGQCKRKNVPSVSFRVDIKTEISFPYDRMLECLQRDLLWKRKFQQ